MDVDRRADDGIAQFIIGTLCVLLAFAVNHPAKSQDRGADAKQIVGAAKP